MLRPAFYPSSPSLVQFKQTHISYVFLVGEYVYKVKKPVHFAFIDCSELSQRFYYCREEVRLNSRLSPSVYLGVFAVFKDGESFVLGPEVNEEHPDAVEYTVKMRRLPDDRILDRLIAAGKVDKRAIFAIAKRIADFHSKAPSSRGQTYGSAEAIRAYITDEIAQNARLVGHTLLQEQFASISAFCDSFIASHWRVLDERADQGRVREGHADLRAEHICITDNEIEVIDCVEFSERLRYCDVASDLAFLVMDLDRLGARGFADELVESYAEATGDEDLAVLVPFYKCYRACVRGKVESLKSLESDVDHAEAKRARELARSYFELAWRYARNSVPALFVVCGLSGTGKSTVARILQHRNGFKILNSDRIRKRLAGVPLQQRTYSAYGTEIYSDSFSRKTYDLMLAEAERLLGEGRGVILDATFKTAADRQLAIALATRRGVPVLIVECVVSEAEAIRRLEQRASNQAEVSDATPAVYEKQRATFEAIREIPKQNHVQIDTTRSKEQLIVEIERMLFN